jgi:bifunctional NMN adenylyltransferase/nudix hydrolase
MSQSILDAVVYIGRFQPVHLAHIQIMEEGLKRARFLVIVIGSSNEPPQIKNPFTFEERIEMIRRSLPKLYMDRVIFIPSVDWLYDDNQWRDQTIESIYEFLKFKSLDFGNIGIIGCNKDQSSFYLSMFPMWKLISIEVIPGFDSSTIRNHWYQSGVLYHHSILTDGAWNYLEEHRNTLQSRIQTLANRRFKSLSIQQEYSGPYEVIFQAVDAIITATTPKGQKILLVERKDDGLLALPGGFLEAKETLNSGCLRELQEETNLVIPQNLESRNQHTFDHPGRSQKGRVITTAFHYHFDGVSFESHRNLIESVKAGSDAARVHWHDIQTLCRNTFHDDHFQIIQYMLNR